MNVNYHQIGKRLRFWMASEPGVRECFNTAIFNLTIKIVENFTQENSKSFVFCFHFGGYRANRRAKLSAFISQLMQD